MGGVSSAGGREIRCRSEGDEVVAAALLSLCESRTHTGGRHNFRAVNESDTAKAQAAQRERGETTK